MVSNNNMELTPAESMILLDPRTNSIELVKVTFLDLLSRKVIEIRPRSVMKGFINKKEKIENFIVKGELFEDIHKPHEEVFQKAFKNKDELLLKKYSHNLVKGLGKHGYSSRDPRGDFPKYKTSKLRNPLVEEGYLVQIKKGGFLKRSQYGHTEYGYEVKEKLENMLKEAGKLNEYISTNPQKAKSLINALGTHIFLLKQYNSHEIIEFNRELSNVQFEDYNLGLATERVSLDDGISLDGLINMDSSIFDAMDTFIDSIDDISDSIDDASSDISDSGGAD